MPTPSLGSTFTRLAATNRRHGFLVSIQAGTSCSCMCLRVSSQGWPDWWFLPGLVQGNPGLALVTSLMLSRLLSSVAPLFRLVELGPLLERLSGRLLSISSSTEVASNNYWFINSKFRDRLGIPARDPRALQIPVSP